MSNRITKIIERVKIFKHQVEKIQPRDLAAIAALLENLVVIEWKLAGDRARLLVATQAFMFGAVFLAMFNANKPAAKLIIDVVPWFGITVVLLASLGIFIAVVVAGRLEYERSYYHALLAEAYKIKIMDVGACRGYYWNGTSGNVKLEKMSEYWLDRTGIIPISQVLGTFPFVIITAMLLFMWISIMITQ